MQQVIRDGALRLMTSEATCDVILNCQGQRLMAHKVMLSIASPLLQELLLADSCETSVLVLPDINATTMTYILDYIYTGSVLLHTTVLKEFLSVANLLKLKIERDSLPYNELELPRKSNMQKTHFDNEEFYTKYYDSQKELIYSKNMLNCDYKTSECGPECYKLAPVYSTYQNLEEKELNISEKTLKFSPIILQDDRNYINGNRCLNNDDKVNLETFKSSELIYNQSDTVINLEVNRTKVKTMRKIPNLMPISRCQFSAFKTRKGLYNRVFPSPWCPRVIPMTVDPRNECLKPHILPTVENGTFSIPDNVKENTEFYDDHNDKNNNSKPPPFNQLNNAYDEKNIPPFRNTPTALNLNVSYKDTKNSVISYENNNSLPIENSNKINLHPSHYETTATNNNNNNNLVIYEANKVETINSECQSVVGGYTKHLSEYSGTESNSSSTDAKSSEECIKVDVRSDEDNGKEDGEMVFDQKQKPYKCEDCGKQFSQLRNYKYHRSVHEGTKEFAARCPECGKVFNDRGYLSSHLKIHRDRKEYGCPHCPKRFNQRVAYNMHLRIHTGIKPHVCPTCSKGFSRKMLLKQHQRVHTGERPYQCPECGKSFADRSNMSLHARLHTGVKPYACNLCPKSFTKKHHLKTHMNYHTGLKPYVCQKCGLTFSQSSNMRTHYKKCIQKDSSSPDANHSSQLK